MVKAEELPFEWDEDLSRCERKHEHECHGVMWQCSKCRVNICCADGSHSGNEELDGLCDNCWSKHHATT